MWYPLGPAEVSRRTRENATSIRNRNAQAARLTRYRERFCQGQYRRALGELSELGPSARDFGHMGCS
jgi:hypothetical protein